MFSPLPRHFSLFLLFIQIPLICLAGAFRSVCDIISQEGREKMLTPFSLIAASNQITVYLKKRLHLLSYNRIVNAGAYARF